MKLDDLFLPDPKLSRGWQDDQNSWTDEGKGRGQSQNIEPDPLQQEDFVVDNVQAEHTHGMIHIEIACQGSRRKLTSTNGERKAQLLQFETEYKTFYF